jgi:phosphonate transport system permease protein
MIPATRAEWLHDWDVVKSEKIAYFQTIQMDIFGTAVSVLIALPLSFFAARTTSFFRPLSVAIKSILNIGRAIPVLVYALIISVGVGLGPPAGAVAITFGTTMALAKLFAEALESISTGPIEAVKASGGNFIQIFVFGMLPQVFPNYISAALYAFEWNIGASAILGIVGAGGLGYDLQNFISFNQSAETGVIIAMLVLTVMLIDYISYRVRLIFA